MQATNWIVGLLMLSVMAVMLLWGLDLVVVAHLTPRPSWRDLFKDGALYLGWYFIVSGIFVYGGIGLILLSSPYEIVPTWFAIPCAKFTIDCILAWYFLSPRRAQPEGVPDDAD